MLCLGYGAYGHSLAPEFSIPHQSLMERGWVVALIHARYGQVYQGMPGAYVAECLGYRGGAELGRKWYEEGKLLQKENTFSDFITASEFLIQQGLGTPGCVIGQIMSHAFVEFARILGAVVDGGLWYQCRRFAVR